MRDCVKPNNMFTTLILDDANKINGFGIAQTDSLYNLSSGVDCTRTTEMKTPRDVS